jgi:hypothetical protein
MLQLPFLLQQMLCHRSKRGRGIQAVYYECKDGSEGIMGLCTTHLGRCPQGKGA